MCVAPRPIEEVRTNAIARERRLVYSRTDDRSVFMINGHPIDDDRIDQTVRLGDSEAWTIVNADQQYHSFRIHRTPFLLTAVNGAAPDDDSLRDIVPVPPSTDAGPGVIGVVIPFTGPEIIGKLVYHCHVVDPEHRGMMGTALVVA